MMMMMMIEYVPRFFSGAKFHWQSNIFHCQNNRIHLWSKLFDWHFLMKFESKLNTAYLFISWKTNPIQHKNQARKKLIWIIYCPRVIQRNPRHTQTHREGEIVGNDGKMFKLKTYSPANGLTLNWNASQVPMINACDVIFLLLFYMEFT